ncbi:dienelactone hydrolase family protein [Ramlibacter sp. AN1015]|uniref:alpha/beta hydrolase n=1 Tax=Ramlibacter sp. AN1015 TaxID=3133428 RepID=UPI0030C5B014
MSQLQTIEYETAADPRASIIVLHGLGADGNDFAPIAESMRLEPVGPVRFVFPHAPVMPVTINNGWPMRAWYDILGTELQRSEDEPGLRRSRDAVDALLRREQERGVPSGRIVLVGFSQGCAMALLTGLRHAQPLAGIAGLSGYLPLAARTAEERHAANARVPVFLGHGTQDAIVQVERGRASRDLLLSLGHEVQWHEYPIGHTVSPQELAALQDWLLRVLAQPDARA